MMKKIFGKASKFVWYYFRQLEKAMDAAAEINANDPEPVLGWTQRQKRARQILQLHLFPPHRHFEILCLERKSLTRHAIRGRFSMWLTTAFGLRHNRLSVCLRSFIRFQVDATGRFSIVA